MAQQGGGPDLSAHLPILISTVVVVLTVVGGFWSLADPRSDLKNIRDNYLSIREHEEFVRRFDRDAERLDNRVIELHKEKADREALTGIQSSLREQINRLQQDTVSRTEFNTLVKERESQIARLQKELDNLQAQVDRWHGSLKGGQR